MYTLKKCQGNLEILYYIFSLVILNLIILISKIYQKINYLKTRGLVNTKH